MAVRPDGHGSLAHGVVVDTRIVARLFRVPILRVDGIVVLSPGRFETESEPPQVVSPPDLPAPAAPSPPHAGVIGDDLSDVSRTLARLRDGGGPR